MEFIGLPAILTIGSFGLLNRWLYNRYFVPKKSKDLFRFLRSKNSTLFSTDSNNWYQVDTKGKNAIYLNNTINQNLKINPEGEIIGDCFPFESKKIEKNEYKINERFAKKYELESNFLEKLGQFFNENNTFYNSNQGLKEIKFTSGYSKRNINFRVRKVKNIEFKEDYVTANEFLNNSFIFFHDKTNRSILCLRSSSNNIWIEILSTILENEIIGKKPIEHNLSFREFMNLKNDINFNVYIL